LKSIITGIGVGTEPAVGRIWKLTAPESNPENSKLENDPVFEKGRLLSAIQKLVGDYEELARLAEAETSEILLALAALANDEALFAASCEYIDAGWSASTSFKLAVGDFSKLFEDDETLSERVPDLEDLASRIGLILAGGEAGLSIPTEYDLILLAEDLSPVVTAQLPRNVVGVITEQGGLTSHTAIICRAKGIPALVAASNCMDLTNGDKVLVDPVGNRAIPDATEAEATPAPSFSKRFEKPLLPVMANVGSLDEAFTARNNLADGVGLLRTEFLYLEASNLPGVDSQVKMFEALLEAAPEGRIVVRTLDAEGDKEFPGLGLPKISFRELTGYRILDLHPQFLDSQLTALEIARKSTGREVSVMAPNIGSAQQAKQFAEFARERGSFEIGVMVELTSIASQIRELQGFIDFISVGTNDLAQHHFDFDRYSSEAPTELTHWNPSFIALLQNIAEAAKEAGVSSSVCGESASDPVFACVLAGIGFNSLSVAATQVLKIQEVLKSLSPNNALELATLALQATSAKQAQNLVTEKLLAL
jgi:phosphotransferase system enzyme I (PtsI)